MGFSAVSFLVLFGLVFVVGHVLVDLFDLEYWDGTDRT